MTCKDCIHYEACKYTAYECEGDYAADAFIDDKCCMANANACPIFYDKSCWLSKEAEKGVEQRKNEN